MFLAFDDVDFVRLGSTHTESARLLPSNDKLSSIIVTAGTWTIYLDADYAQPNGTYTPGLYSRPMDTHGMLNDHMSSIQRIAEGGISPQPPQILLFENEGAVGAQQLIQSDTSRIQQNTRSGSFVITRGTWQFFDRQGYTGASSKVGPGFYKFADILVPAVSVKLVAP